MGTRNYNTIVEVPVQDSSRSCCWSNQLQLEINAQQICHKRDQNWTLQGEPLLISSGSTFWPFLKDVSFARRSKTGSSGWIRCLLEGPVLSPPMHLLQLRCSNVETHQPHTNQHRVDNKGLEQGRSQLRLQKSYQFQVQKTNPKTSLLYLLVLIMTTFPFLLCWCKRSRVSKACNRGASRLGEATPRTRNYIILWSPSKAELEVVGACAALLEF